MAYGGSYITVQKENTGVLSESLLQEMTGTVFRCQTTISNLTTLAQIPKSAALHSGNGDAVWGRYAAIRFYISEGDPHDVDVLKSHRR